MVGYRNRRVYYAVGFGAPLPPPSASFATSTPGSRSRSRHAISTKSQQQRYSSCRGSSASTSLRTAASKPVRPSFGLKSRDEIARMQSKKRLNKKQGGFNKLLTRPSSVGSSNSFSKSLSLVVDSMEVAPPSPPTCHRAVKRRKTVKQHRPSAIQKALCRAASDISRTMEELEEEHRRLTSKQRIAECIVGLRAASVRSASIRQFQLDHRDEVEHRKPSFRDLCGDYGMALFSPLDLEAFEPSLKDEGESSEPEIVPEPIHYPVQMDIELPYVLKSCPLILKPDMISQLMDYLPETVRTMTWKRIFASGRDGDVFLNMLNRAHNYDNTIVVCETTRGHVLGGFAAVPWDRQSGHGTSFYGNGQSFLFASHPKRDFDAEREPGDSLFIFKWTGNNDYCQVCDVDEGQIAMGGGGAFGLIVDTNFSRGTTGRCITFDNPPLVPYVGGTFELVNFEVYGFVSLAERLGASSPPTSSTHPLNKPPRRSLLRMDSPLYDNPLTK